MKTLLFDENNVQIADLGNLPTIPSINEIVFLTTKRNQYESAWMIVHRNWMFDPTKQMGMVALSAQKVNIPLTINTINLTA